MALSRPWGVAIVLNYPCGKAQATRPAIVIGEVHHPVEAREIFNPSWLTIPERGLYTGVAIFGAVGSGKTSGCMHPFAKQLLGWQAGNPQKRAAALVLEVKGDFCHDVRQILTEAGRGNDYIELSMEGPWQWNPLSAWWLDSYSLAYTVSSLLNQLFGKGKEPFWQQAYTNLVRWIIELYRALPERWVTLQMVYRCAIDPELFAKKIKEAEAFSDELNKGTVFVSRDVLKAQAMNLAEWVWQDTPGTKEKQTPYSRPLVKKLDELNIPNRIVWLPGRGDDVRERVAAVRRWFEHDWQTLDNKIKSSIVEGISVFLAMFDLPDVAKVFCPAAPAFSYDPKAISFQAGERMRAERQGREAVQSQEPQPTAQDETPDFWPGVSPARDGEDPVPEAQADPKKKKPIPAKEGADRVTGPRHLPPIHDLIDDGKVLTLNMPAGTNPALARAVGVMLKNAWLQSLLMRPAKMKQSPGVYFRPAVFICDEYQAFASVGEDDPSGDEKSFALTRQCRCIPIVAHNPFPRSGRSWEARRRGGRFCRPYGPGYSSRSVTTPAPGLQASCAGRWRRSRIPTPSARLPSDRGFPPYQAAPGGAAVASALPNLSRSAARPCFTRETSPCWGTVKRSVCPMTGRSRWSRAAFT